VAFKNAAVFFVLNFIAALEILPIGATIVALTILLEINYEPAF
jgi:hypothetical protein